MASFYDLPDVLVLNIFEMIPVKSRIRCGRVCKHWYKLLYDKWLWVNVNLTANPLSKLILTQVIKRYFNEHTKSLSLSGNGFRKRSAPPCLSNPVLKQLTKNCSNLVSLKVEEENLVNGVKLVHLPDRIKELTLAQCEFTVDTLDGCEEKFAKLKKLSFIRCPCLTAKHLSSFGALDNLTSLYIMGCYRVDHSAVCVITQSFKNLKRLSLLGCAHCYDRTAKLVSQTLKDLRFLEIEEWVGLTEIGVSYLTRDLNLKFFSVKNHNLNNGLVQIFGSRLDCD